MSVGRSNDGRVPSRERRASIPGPAIRKTSTSTTGHACSECRHSIAPLPPSEVRLTNTTRCRLRALRSAALLATSLSLACAGATKGSVASDPDRKDWIDLFNGRNLDGWTAKIAKHEVGENFGNTFRVVDGVIQARYDGYGGNYNAQFGHLYYDKPFSYYLVSTEYRFLGELYPGAPSYTLRNSGIMTHSQDPRTMPRDQNFPIC